MYIADFVEDADSPDWSLLVVLPSYSKKMPVRYLQVAHDHFFLHPSYPANTLVATSSNVCAHPHKKLSRILQIQGAPCVLHTATQLSFLMKPVHYFAHTSPDCILIPHYVTSIGLCIFRYYTEATQKCRQCPSLGVHKLSKNLGAISKFEVPEWWDETFHTEDPEIFGVMVKNLIALVT